MSHNQNRGCAALVYTTDAGDFFFLRKKWKCWNLLLQNSAVDCPAWQLLASARESNTNSY